MLRSLYIAGTGMIVQREKMNVLTNNIANAETSGYKKDQLLSRSFKDVLINEIDNTNIINISDTIGSQNYGTHIDEIVIDYTQGSFEETARLTDLAISGPGFFVVSTPNGDRYTRDGSFSLDSQGYLVNSDGHYLQGTGGGRINVGDGGFGIDEQGNVVVDGAVVGKVRLVRFNNLEGLRKDGNNLYSNSTNQRVFDDTESTIKQGVLEVSNVDITQEMVDMMNISRNYQMNQKMVTMIDQSLEKSVNEVGRV